MVAGAEKGRGKGGGMHVKANSGLAVPVALAIWKKRAHMRWRGRRHGTVPAGTDGIPLSPLSLLPPPIHASFSLSLPLSLCLSSSSSSLIILLNTLAGVWFFFPFPGVRCLLNDFLPFSCVLLYSLSMPPWLDRHCVLASLLTHLLPGATLYCPPSPSSEQQTTTPLRFPTTTTTHCTPTWLPTPSHTRHPFPPSYTTTTTLYGGGKAWDWRHGYGWLVGILRDMMLDV